jgi:nitroimidazol reductase NimA-like FMN-containing flavoprotein (pyridoxamine 5'-phosphate oxidase superfamily)
MRENPAVCLEVDEIRDKDHWTTVLVFGRYRELHRRNEDAEDRRSAEQLFERRHEWWLPAAGKLGDQEPSDIVLYSIDVDSLTGRRAQRLRVES